MRITASRDGGDAHVFTVTETGVDMDEEELTLSLQSVGPFNWVSSSLPLGKLRSEWVLPRRCPVLGEDRTLLVRGCQDRS